MAEPPSPSPSGVVLLSVALGGASATALQAVLALALVLLGLARLARRDRLALADATLPVGAFAGAVLLAFTEARGVLHVEWVRTGLLLAGALGVPPGPAVRPPSPPAWTRRALLVGAVVALVLTLAGAARWRPAPPGPPRLDREALARDLPAQRLPEPFDLAPVGAADAAPIGSPVVVVARVAWPIVDYPEASVLAGTRRRLVRRATYVALAGERAVLVPAAVVPPSWIGRAVVVFGVRTADPRAYYDGEWLEARALVPLGEDGALLWDESRQGDLPATEPVP